MMMFPKAVAMARINRRLVLSETEIQVVHCTNRCVRRANLCGIDPVTGRDCEHRRQWIRDRLAFLAGIFAVDVLAFSVTGNQFHVVLRSRPDVAREWSNEEVAIRWWQLFPQRRTREGKAAEPAEMDLQVLVARSQELRLRFSSISWFMRCVSEVIARWANAEDQCTGRFWEGRFKSTLLEDNAAVLGGMIFVDLNGVQASETSIVEDSHCTSLRARLQDLAAVPPEVSGAKAELFAATGEQSGWLSPMKCQEVDEHSSGTCSTSRRRASDCCCTSLSLIDYQQLAEWTAACIRSGGTRVVVEYPPRVVRTLQIDAAGWLTLISRFSKRRTCSFPRSTISKTGAPGPVAGIAGQLSNRWIARQPS